MKKYKVGFYGGKFMPLHLGHKYCIDVAAQECEKLYVILFYGGADEDQIKKNASNIEDVSCMHRWWRLQVLCGKYDNVYPVNIDVSSCRLPNGEEDWDAETPLVLNKIGKFDAVYSSEPSYGEYFKRAYPWAEHVLVDPPRIVYPISATKIREMKRKEEKLKWTI